MTTLSVPLTPELAQFIEDSIKETGLTRAALVRVALERYQEEEAINAVLKAEHEVSEGKLLDGDLETMLK